jgi:membrane protein
VAGIPVGGHAQGRDDNGAALAYNVFLALFPLLLVVVAVLGFLLGRDSRFQQRLPGPRWPSSPVIGDQVQDNIQGLRGSGSAWWLGWWPSRGAPAA